MHKDITGQAAPAEQRDPARDRRNPQIGVFGEAKLDIQTHDPSSGRPAHTPPTPHVGTPERNGMG
eukprot:8266834-Pyramimonas_sp.AAC.1